MIMFLIIRAAIDWLQTVQDRDHPKWLFTLLVTLSLSYIFVQLLHPFRGFFTSVIVALQSTLPLKFERLDKVGVFVNPNWSLICPGVRKLGVWGFIKNCANQLRSENFGSSLLVHFLKWLVSYLWASWGGHYACKAIVGRSQFHGFRLLN